MSMKEAMYLQKAFRSQLDASKQIIKEKKLDKQTKQMQNAIASAVAAFERFEDDETQHARAVCSDLLASKDQI